MTDTPGVIITFYSYKGGTGRSMALANVAWILAANGHSVLAIDWDFEAPGLHRYFRPFLIDNELSSTPGLIDFFWSYATKAMTPRNRNARDDETVWWEGVTDLGPYTVQLDWAFPGNGCVDLIAAGRQDADYAERVNGFDWTKLYRRLDGALLLDALRRRLRREYEFVLIDSRTGVSDTSGICTVAMPDRLVALCTLNRQSVDGVAAVLSSITPQRTADPLAIYPVISRVELVEKDRLDAARRRARGIFSPYLKDHGREADYWTDTEILYQPYYAYEEVLAPFGDATGANRSPNSLLAAMERLASRVSGLQRLEMPTVPEAQRHEVLGQFAGTDRTPQASAVVDDSAERRERARRYIEKDLGDPIPVLRARADKTRYVAQGTTVLSLAAAFATIATTGFWNGATLNMRLSLILLALLASVAKNVPPFARWLGPVTTGLLRVTPALAFVGISIAMVVYRANAVTSSEMAPLLITAFSVLGALAESYSAVALLPESANRLRAAVEEIEHAERTYVNSVGEYASESDPRAAWQSFTGRLEAILDTARHR